MGILEAIVKQVRRKTNMPNVKHADLKLTLYYFVGWCAPVSHDTEELRVLAGIVVAIERHA